VVVNHLCWRISRSKDEIGDCAGRRGRKSRRGTPGAGYRAQFFSAKSGRCGRYRLMIATSTAELTPRRAGSGNLRSRSGRQAGLGDARAWPPGPKRLRWSNLPDSFWTHLPGLARPRDVSTQSRRLGGGRSRSYRTCAPSCGNWPTPWPPCAIVHARRDCVGRCHAGGLAAAPYSVEIAERLREYAGDSRRAAGYHLATWPFARIFAFCREKWFAEGARVASTAHSIRHQARISAPQCRRRRIRPSPPGSAMPARRLLEAERRRRSAL